MIGFNLFRFQSTAATAAQDEEFLRALHKTLFDVHVLEGALCIVETVGGWGGSKS